MKALLIPFGPAGSALRRRLYDELVAERRTPPFLFNDVLVLVPSARLRRGCGRMFLAAAERLLNTAAIVPPDVQTLHQFIATRRRARGGPALLDENGRLVLIEGIVKQRLAASAAFGGPPELLAPSLSASVADMIDDLSSSGVDAAAFAARIAGTEASDKPHVRLLTDVYRRYEEVLAEKGVVDPPRMLASVAGDFDPAWLAPYSRVMIDGFHDADGFQTAILKSIAQTASCTVLIPGPRADLVSEAPDYHPLRPTKEFAARAGFTLRDPADIPDAGEQFLAAALFSERSFSDAARGAPLPAAFSREIRLLSAVNTREELTLIAREVKQSLLRGSAPDTILVAFPSLDEYAALLEEIFTDYGLPYNRALGRQLSSSPVTTALLSLLQACRDELTASALLRVLGSPFLKFADSPSLAPELDRLLRLRRITGGRQKILSAVRDRHASTEERDLLSAPLADLFSALEPFSRKDQLPLAEWMDLLDGLIEWSGLASRVSLIRGPLNRNLQALKKLRETLASLRAAGTLAAEYRYAFTEWLFLLRKTFMHTRFQVPPEDESGVQVLGLEESGGGPWSEVYLGGLTDGAFPQRLPQNIFLPEATLEALGVRTLEKARLSAAYQFYRLVLAAPKVTLTWPEHQGDRPVVPSPFLEELRPLRISGLLNRNAEKTSEIQFSLRVGESRSVAELAKALSVAGSVDGIEQVFDASLSGLAQLAAAYGARPSAAGQTIPPPARTEFSVTELDLYLRCPYEYYIVAVLGVEPLEEVSEDISPLERGTKVHRILRNFYRSWSGPVTRDNRGKALRLLRDLADEAFRREADTFRNRKEKEWFLLVMAERFLDSEEAFWASGFRPAYLEQTIERFTLRLTDGREVGIRATIDRIDADEAGNFVIVDYKTGAYPLPKSGTEQDIFQLPVYAVMAKTAAASGDLPLLKKPAGLAYYDLSGRNRGPARDLVLYDAGILRDQPASKPKCSPRSGDEFEDILRRSMDKARAAVEGVLSGDFAARPADESRCRYCPNEMLCRNEP